MNISAYRNLHPGQHCAILCNGESVRSFPPDWPHVTIGINRSWMIKNSSYHCIVSSFQLRAAIKAGVPFDHLFIGSIEGESKRVFWERIPHSTCTELVGHTRDYIDEHGIGFAVDLEHEPIWIPNAPYFALQIAAWMGFKQIDFWGLDLCGPKFWASELEMRPDTAEEQDRYFHHAAGVLEERGVFVVNWNRQSMCTAFRTPEEEEQRLLGNLRKAGRRIVDSCFGD